MQVEGVSVSSQSFEIFQIQRLIVATAFVDTVKMRLQIVAKSWFLICIMIIPAYVWIRMGVVGQRPHRRSECWLSLREFSDFVIKAAWRRHSVYVEVSAKLICNNYSIKNFSDLTNSVLQTIAVCKRRLYAWGKLNACNRQSWRGIGYDGLCLPCRISNNDSICDCGLCTITYLLYPNNAHLKFVVVVHSLCGFVTIYTSQPFP